MSLRTNHGVCRARVTLVLALMLSCGVHAATITVNLAPDDSATVSSLSYAASAGDPSLTVTAWSNSSTGAFAIQQEQLARQSGVGIGVEDQAGREGMVDNLNGDYDALLLSFSRSVAVTRLGYGSFDTDADMSLLAYTGNTPFSGNLSRPDNDWGALLNEGWSVAGNYNRNGTGTFSVNPLAVTSQYWLVSAYNTDFGGSLSRRNDAFRLNSITFEAAQNQVPEPSSWALIATALAGLAGVQRSRRHAQAAVPSRPCA